jgi:hypothetical protein
LINGETISQLINETTTVQTLLDDIFDHNFKKETEVEFLWLF